MGAGGDSIRAWVWRWRTGRGFLLIDARRPVRYHTFMRDSGLIWGLCLSLLMGTAPAACLCSGHLARCCQGAHAEPACCCHGAHAEGAVSPCCRGYAAAPTCSCPPSGSQPLGGSGCGCCVNCQTTGREATPPTTGSKDRSNWVRGAGMPSFLAPSHAGVLAPTALRARPDLKLSAGRGGSVPVFLLDLSLRC